MYKVAYFLIASWVLRYKSQRILENFTLKSLALKSSRFWAPDILEINFLGYRLSCVSFIPFRWIFSFFFLFLFVHILRLIFLFIFLLIYIFSLNFLVYLLHLSTCLSFAIFLSLVQIWCKTIKKRQRWKKQLRNSFLNIILLSWFSV